MINNTKLDFLLIIILEFVNNIKNIILIKIVNQYMIVILDKWINPKIKIKKIFIIITVKQIFFSKEYVFLNIYNNNAKIIIIIGIKIIIIFSPLLIKSTINSKYPFLLNF